MLVAGLELVVDLELLWSGRRAQGMRLERPRPQLKGFAKQLKSFLSLLSVPTGVGLLFQPQLLVSLGQHLWQAMYGRYLI